MNVLPIRTMTTSSWAQSRISHNQARILSYVVLFVTSYSKSKAEKRTTVDGECDEKHKSTCC